MTVGHKDTDGEFNRIEGREVAVVGEISSETAGLRYNEWGSEITDYGAGTGGPRLRAETDGVLRITSVTVDANASGDTEIALKEINSDDTHGSTVDTAPISVTEGVNEADVDIIVPATGEDYVLSLVDSNTVELGVIVNDTVDIPYPIEGDHLTVINNSHPEGFASAEGDYSRFFDIEVEEAAPPTASATLSNDKAIEFEQIESRGVTFVGELSAETAGLAYDEWESEIDTYYSGGAGPRLRAEIDGPVRITGATVDADAAGDTEVALKEINSDDTHGSTVDTAPISVTEGVNEVEFDIVVPSTGEEYVLTSPDSAAIGFGALTDDSPSVPYPIEGDILTVVNNSHPEGFTGPESSYVAYFDIEVEEASPSKSTASIQSGEVVEFSDLATGVHNGTQYVKPGDLVDAVHSAEPDDVIKLHAGKVYEPAEEIVVPNEVTIDCNNSIIQPTSDHNVFFLSPKCTIKNAQILTGAGYEFTSVVFDADTGRLGESYHGSGRGIKIDAICGNRGDHMSGTCFQVNVANGGEWFSVQQDIHLKMTGYYDGIHMHVAANGHANGNRIDAHIWGCGVNIRKTGAGNCSTRIVGEMDGTDSGANGGTQYMFYSDDSSGRPITFEGYLWDSFNAAQEQIHGEINIIAHNRPHPTLLPESPNAAGLVWWLDTNEIGYADLGGQINYRMRFSSDWWRFEVDTSGGRDFRDMMSFRPLENMVRVNGELMVGSLTEVN